MSNKSEIIVASKSPELAGVSAANSHHRLRDLLEICAVFGLVLAAVWTPPGRLNSLFVYTASVCVLVFVARGRWNAMPMGLTRPASGVVQIVLIGTLLCGVVALVGIPLRFAGPGYRIPWFQWAEYGWWALAQEFILQAVFFLRFEALVGSRRALFASAAAYALAHLPSPILTGLSWLGGVVFCELFRRWRNLYPIGMIHGALGLTIAASFPDKWLHHMRVGIGYLAMH
jgi:Type II CAAX prenyl endopeptidase Rce1-like